jgi:hypothetical protein
MRVSNISCCCALFAGEYILYTTVYSTFITLYIFLTVSCRHIFCPLVSSKQPPFFYFFFTPSFLLPLPFHHLILPSHPQSLSMAQARLSDKELCMCTFFFFNSILFSQPRPVSLASY